MTGPHSLQQSARVMAAVERDIFAAPISTDAIARYHSDPAYRASVEDRRAQFHREFHAKADASSARFWPHPWKD
jgi:hypothetical protein